MYSAIIIILIAVVVGFPAALYGEIYFEGGPSFQELLYENPIPANHGPNISLKQAIGQNIADWMESCQKRGINLFSMPLYSREGIFLFNSVILENAGFRQIEGVGDIFPAVLGEARKRGLSLSVSLDDLAHIINGTMPYKEWLNPDKLSCENIAKLVDELGSYSRRYHVQIWINEESFGPNYQQALANACRRSNVVYVRYFGDRDGNADIFCSEDYATYPIGPETDQKVASHLLKVSEWGAAYGRIGYQNIMFGKAKALGKKSGVLTAGGWGLVPGCQRNIALFRAVQFAPTLYCFHAAAYSQKPYINVEDTKYVESFNYRKQLLPLIEKFARSPDDTEKPLANLILDYPEPAFSGQGADIFENALMSSAEAITNAISAAGFDLAVSTGKPIPNAQLYYVFTAGSSPRLNLYRDISPKILPAFSQQQVPVYLQCALGLPRGKNWRKVAALLGFPGKASLLTCPFPHRLSSPIPSHCNFEFPTGTAQVAFRGYQLWVNTLEEAGKLAIYHHLSDIPFGAFDPDVEFVATGEVNGRTLPLLTRHKNYFFVNGNFIHLDFSSILCNLMASFPVFYSMSSVYLTQGKERSAIFAAADTRIDIALPQTGNIYHWHSDGKPYVRSPLDWNGLRLQGSVKKWELVIVLGEQKEKTK